MAVVDTYGVLDIMIMGQAPSTDWSNALSATGYTPGYPSTSVDVAPVAVKVDVIDNGPIVEQTTIVESYYHRSFLQDYYFRVHTTPAKIDAGNLLSTQVRDVEIWNAHHSTQLLSSIDAVATDSIDLIQPELAPTTFAALEGRIYTVRISQSGPPVIDARYTFNFSDQAPELTITGRRVVVWPFVPQTEHSEELEWLTDILPSYNNEQRLALRTAPRQSFTYQFHLEPQQFSRAKAMATRWGHRVYGVPVWTEATRVGPLNAAVTEIFLDTAHADYRENDIILVWQDDVNFLAVENLGIYADKIALKLPLQRGFDNSYVMPLRFARTPQGINFKRGSVDIVTASGTFLVTENRDLASRSSYPQYRGKDVLVDRSVLLGSLSERIHRSIETFDNGSGQVAVDPRRSYATHAQTITFDPLDRAHRWQTREWLHTRRGRQKGFWLPSWNNDLIIVQNVSAEDVGITIRPVGYPVYYTVRDIMVCLNDGTDLFNRVLSGSVAPDGNEVLSLEGPFGRDFFAHEVTFVCFMSHVRLNADRLSLKHSFAGRMSVNIPVMETAEE